MAAQEKEIQTKKMVMAQKMAYYKLLLDDLIPTVGSYGAFFYDKKAVAALVDALRSEEAATIQDLASIPEFQTWRHQAIQFLWKFLQDPRIFDINTQKKLQPLVDLFYYFNTDDTVLAYLQNFEAIKSITQAQSLKFPRQFFSYKEQLTERIFHRSDESVARIIKQLFNSYTGLDTENPTPYLVQAYVAAHFILYLRSHPDLVLLTKERREAFDAAINELYKTYFSLKKFNENYYNLNNPQNRNLISWFKKCKDQVDRRVASVTTPLKCMSFLPSSCIEGDDRFIFLLFLKSHIKEGVLDLKSLFLELFPINESKHNGLPFFVKEDPVGVLLRKKEVDWNEVLCALLADKGNMVESEYITFFAEVVSLVKAQESTQSEQAGVSSSFGCSA